MLSGFKTAFFLQMSDSKSEIEMNDDLKQLTYYSLESNDHVLLRTTT